MSVVLYFQINERFLISLYLVQFLPYMNGSYLKIKVRTCRIRISNNLDNNTNLKHANSKGNVQKVKSKDFFETYFSDF